MKKTIIYKLGFTVFAMLFIIASQAQLTERNKKIVRSFKVKSETNVQITNKYGNIHIVPESTDSVRIEIEVKVSDKKPDKAIDLLSNINVEFNDSPYYIIAKTVFADYKGSAWSEISDLASTSISGGNKVEINWLVYIPEHTELKIDNKFGNVYTTNHSGSVSFTVSNGDFQAYELTGETKLKVEFGNINLRKLTNAKMDVMYAEIELKSALKLDINSRYSKWNFPVVKEINMDSKHDKISIDSIQTIKGEATFTTLKIGNLQKDILLKQKYGNIVIDNLTKDIRYLNINASSSDVSLIIPEIFDAKFSLNYRKTILSLPDFISVFPKELSNPETQEFKISGTIGTEKPDLPELKFSVTGGSITLGKK
jgi:hypothetical protein